MVAHCAHIVTASVLSYTESMKKLLGILVLGLLWCNTANAKETVEYLGNDVWLIKYDYNFT